jgi:DNA repair protein RadC
MVGTEADHGTAPHYQGHRQRLRERLLTKGGDSLQDYELLELLLFSAIPRRDVKPLAKQLLAEFRTLWALVNAPAERLLRFGLSECVVATLLVTGAVIIHASKKEIVGGSLLNNWQRVVDHCRMAMAHETVEQFRLLFLDRKNHLIAEEVQQRGTIDHTPVYPREIVKRALELGAGALVLAHNHPSGDPAPSKDDIAMTRAIVNACRPLGLTIHDHIVVGRDGIASFKNLGLL